jgi:D-lactate dehydrogenase
MTLQEHLLEILPPKQVKTSLIDVMAYAADAGFYHLIPKAVVQPTTVKEVKQLFNLAHHTKVPLVFRAGGTSLSGQSITDGILVDIAKHWRKIQVEENGKYVVTQPGITGAMVNAYLKPFKRKIGPDPSSISAAMMGGILSNNSSGMCCGVVYNSYHTLQHVHFVLPNGNDYNTAHNSHYETFLHKEKEIAETLTQLRLQIINNSSLHHTIREKYKTKNTVGYGLNAFIDFEHPLDILAHLLIGAEGSLAFIAESSLQTLPALPFTATAMLYFNTIYDACNSIVPLKNTGADVLELMDRASLHSVENLKGLPDFFKSLPPTAACILCEYQAEKKEALEQKITTANNTLAQLQLLHTATFTQDAYQRDFYWKIRKGMFPSVGAVRAKGTTVLLEDVAFPVERLADAVIDLQHLFKQFNYIDAIIFGHAKDGNIHFVVTQLLDTPEEVKRYDDFMKAIIQLVLHKYNGALKAEHGTGRNMAPFVEAEWGGDAYTIMKTLKQVIDPYNILNPGVIINEDKEAHIKHLKQMPVVEEEVDKCIECGYCEPNCPSRDVTLSPRQRIQVRRQLQRFKANNQQKEYDILLNEYQYQGLDTCATDGLCQADCPVSINTGDLVKRLRKEQHNNFTNKIANSLSKNFNTVEKATRIAIKLATIANSIFGKNFVQNFTTTAKKIIPSFPLWWNEIGKAPTLISSTPTQPDVVYFSACLNRAFGAQPASKNLQETFLSVCKKAGKHVLLPKNIAGKCCGQPFSSKGFNDAARNSEQVLIDNLLAWSNNGALPIVIDFTSCTYTLLHNEIYMTEVYKKKLNSLKIYDSLQYLQQFILPAVSINNKKNKVILHPVCSSKKLHIENALTQIAQACATEVIVPKYAGCCGMAGDRGFLFPELTKAATQFEVQEVLEHTETDGYYSSGTTCEMALAHNSGKQYKHIVYLLDDVMA